MYFYVSFFIIWLCVCNLCASGAGSSVCMIILYSEPPKIIEKGVLKTSFPFYLYGLSFGNIKIKSTNPLTLFLKKILVFRFFSECVQNGGQHSVHVGRRPTWTYAEWMDSCHWCKSVLKKGVSCRQAAGMTCRNFWTVALCVKGGKNGGIYVIYTHMYP